MDVYHRAKSLLGSADSAHLVQIATLIRQAIDADQVLVVSPFYTGAKRFEIVWSDPEARTTKKRAQATGEPAYLLPLDSIRSMARTQLEGKKSVAHYFNKGFMWSGPDVGHESFEAIRLETATAVDPLIYLWIRKAERLFTEKCRKDFEGLLNVIRSKRFKKMIGQQITALGPVNSRDLLSPTEQKVLGFLMQGLTEREIAREMGRSHNTIHVHVRSIYRKHLVHSRAELLDQARNSEMNTPQ